MSDYLFGNTWNRGRGEKAICPVCGENYVKNVRHQKLCSKLSCREEWSKKMARERTLTRGNGS